MPSIALMDGDSGYRCDKRCGWMRMDFATGVMQDLLAISRRFLMSSEWASAKLS